MRSKKPDEIKYLEILAKGYNFRSSGKSEEDKKGLRDAFGRVYQSVHAHDRWMYYVLEQRDVDWSWDALEKTDVSPEPRTVYDAIHKFAETPDEECKWHREITDKDYLKYLKQLLSLTKDASERFVQRAKGHFGGKQLIQIVRGEYKTDIVSNVLNNLNGESVRYDKTLKTGKYVFGLLNKRVPKMIELEPLIRGVLETCVDKAPFPSGMRGNSYHSCTIDVEIPTGEKRGIEVDYSVALAAALYQLTKVEPSKELINAMVRKRINGARRLRNIESIRGVGNRCSIYFGPISGIDGLLGGICSSVLNGG